MDSACTGLGFIHHSLGEKRKYDDSNINSLMSQYMKSCLDYHQQQEKNELSAPSDLPSFIPATKSTSLDVSFASTLNQNSANGKIAYQNSKQNAASNNICLSERAQNNQSSSWKEEAITNARAIAKRLTMGEVDSAIDTTSPLEYVERRKKFAQKHNLKLQQALLKNFSYVMCRDAQDSQILMSRIKQVDHQQHQMKQKRSTAGIGTKEQVRSFRKSELCPTIGVYITGLPTNQSPELEETLRTLFGAYGSVNKVIIYTDKRTKKRKGDGLILYQSSPKLVETVCSQLNGAELPCGSTLTVEPADMNYKEKQNNKYMPTVEKTSASTNESRISHNEANDTAESNKFSSHDEEDDNLDDFFASLE